MQFSEKQVLTLDVIETFHHGNIFERAVFCLSDKQGTIC